MAYETYSKHNPERNDHINDAKHSQPLKTRLGAAWHTMLNASSFCVILKTHLAICPKSQTGAHNLQPHQSGETDTQAPRPSPPTQHHHHRHQHHLIIQYNRQPHHCRPPTLLPVITSHSPSGSRTSTTPCPVQNKQQHTLPPPQS